MKPSVRVAREVFVLVLGALRGQSTKSKRKTLHVSNLHTIQTDEISSNTEIRNCKNSTKSLMKKQNLTILTKNHKMTLFLHSSTAFNRFLYSSCVGRSGNSDKKPQSNINGVMVFGYIPIDVVETSIANLDVYLTYK